MDKYTTIKYLILKYEELLKSYNFNLSENSGIIENKILKLKLLLNG